MTRSLGLVVRNVVFTVVVPGLGGAWLPWWLLTHGHGIPAPAAWEAVPVIAAGAALYFWCAWNFATVGGGPPGPWDAPRRVVAHGPYRWVRNPMYLGAGGALFGAALFYGALPLAAYAALFLIAMHLFVLGYEEPTLRETFGADYETYCRRVGRWYPRHLS